MFIGVVTGATGVTGVLSAHCKDLGELSRAVQIAEFRMGTVRMLYGCFADKNAQVQGAKLLNYKGLGGFLADLRIKWGGMGLGAARRLRAPIIQRQPGTTGPPTTGQWDQEPWIRDAGWKPGQDEGKTKMNSRLTADKLRSIANEPEGNKTNAQTTS